MLRFIKRATDKEAAVKFALENKIDMVMVAPDDPLSLGMVDDLEAAGIRAFGPVAKAAQIEASKVFSKALMKKYNIPTAAYEVFEQEGVDIELISLAKKQEEIYTLQSDQPVILQKNDYCLRLLQRIRDEAHRFAITYHRSLRQKRSFYSQLNEIEGLGKKKINALLTKFGSVAEIQRASKEELMQTEGIGEKHAQNIYSYFHEKGDKNED